MSLSPKFSEAQCKIPGVGCLIRRTQELRPGESQCVEYRFAIPTRHSRRWPEMLVVLSATLLIATTIIGAAVAFSQFL